MEKKILVTGGAGFIGVHTVRRFCEMGYAVVVLDNLSRKGSSVNLEQIREKYRIKFYNVDIRNYPKVVEVFETEKQFEAIIHLAAQVAVTTSVLNPREDFEINALGTFNMLETFRLYSPEAIFIYSSTNKIYGALEDIEIIEHKSRYDFKDIEGIDENRQLDFHSPYGCSKGAADQYVVDYGRIYRLSTVSFRQSCIYGQNQFGIEDQGWVAWFIIASLLKLPLTIYGDGKQVRDILFVEDLVDLYVMAVGRRDSLKAKAYNIGGGSRYALSLLELIDILRAEGIDVRYSYGDWRPGDQKVFISDNTKVNKEIGWAPTTPPSEGIPKLIDWVNKNRELIRLILGIKK